jgi:hypothetical protein
VLAARAVAEHPERFVQCGWWCVLQPCAQCSQCSLEALTGSTAFEVCRKQRLLELGQLAIELQRDLRVALLTVRFRQDVAQLPHLPLTDRSVSRSSRYRRNRLASKKGNAAVRRLVDQRSLCGAGQSTTFVQRCRPDYCLLSYARVIVRYESSSPLSGAISPTFGQ